MGRKQFSLEDIEHLGKTLENLKDEEDLRTVFKIISKDPNLTFGKSTSSVYFDLANVSDDTLQKLCRSLKKINNKKTNEIEVDTSIIPEYASQSNRTYKLTNYEKNILKRRNQKKVLDEDDDYKELSFSYKKPVKKVTKKAISKKLNC